MDFNPRYQRGCTNEAHQYPQSYVCNRPSSQYGGYNDGGGNGYNQPSNYSVGRNMSGGGNGIVYPPSWSQHQQQVPQWRENQNCPAKESNNTLGCMPVYPPSGHPTPGSPSSYNSLNRQENLQQPLYPTEQEFSAFYASQTNGQL